MRIEHAMAWATTPYVKKLEEPERMREQLHCDALEALHMEVLRLRIVCGAYREAVSDRVRV